jgi:hypothetical protein
VNNRLRHFLLIIGTVAISNSVVSPTPVFAQGTYTDEGVDDDGFIWTDLYGYPPPPGDCNSIVFWNSVNGNYVSGYGPDAIESGTYGSPSANYDWDWGLDEEYIDPLLNCNEFSSSSHNIVAYSITYTATVDMFPDPNGWCNQKLACLNSSATCNVPKIQEVAGSICDYFHESLVFILNGTCEGALSFPASGPGVCT